MKKTKLGPKLIVIFLMIYLFMPFVITGVYSLTDNWSNTILPSTFTLKFYVELFSEGRFWMSILRSVFVSALSVAAAVLVMTPLVFAVCAFTPRLEAVMKMITLIPYAIPGVISAVALLRAYGGTDIPMVLVLAGAYFILVMPLVYSGVNNAMHAIDIVPITEAARVLGASTLTTFLRIIVPGVAPGILVSTLLSFSTLFGEFVVANMLIGGSYETVQIYLDLVMKQTGHLSSAVVIIYVLIMTLICALVMKLSGGKPKNVA
ncbi:MAG: ABC transporter permease subunit [Christensenellales bacterium]|jgi:putative spermidine/putrescine transport system permease protein|uniref:ABC transporter permease subunit n=1 Tax=Candidatus Avichristensenella intestinipullorum TaxID=2840693 RepID=A0A9D0YZJ4_9FIRM|nr:ABC transporter permease subunit [Christensenellales bacterium]HIQ63688.1 ABC transporter permease subunit [Candidatus Avichristensenella intestinipullorum]